MTKAKGVHSTQRKRTSKKPSFPVSFIEVVSDTYAMKVVGSCLDPIVPDGSVIVLSKTDKAGIGDVVCLYMRSSDGSPDGSPQVKRLVMAVPHFVTFPFDDHPGSEVTPIFTVEQLNPPRRYCVRCRDVQAMHRAIGVVLDGGKVGDMVYPDAVKPIPRTVPKERR
jgi:hypothetical protein